MDKKHGIPNPLASNVSKRQRAEIAREKRETSKAGKRKSISNLSKDSSFISAEPKAKRAKTTDDIPFAAGYRPAPPSPSARSELPDR